MMSFFSLAGQALSVFGRPPLFALKVLFWTVVWLGDLGLKIVSAGWQIILGSSETLLWFIKVFFTVFFTFLKRLFSAIAYFRGYLTSMARQRWQKKKLKLPRRWRKPPQIRSAGLILLGATLTLLFFFIPYWLKSELEKLPHPALLAARDIPVSTKIYDRRGVLLYQIYTNENRTLVTLDQLPKYLPEAAIAIEDKNFSFHLGFDLTGIVRAAFANASGEISQGGSTITQQLVRSALLTPERTVDRKIKEIILSLWAEKIYSKNQILTMYLNQIPYGGTAYGVEAAAQTFFGKPARDLTLAEAAYLSGLPSAPSTFSPFGPHPELAKTRQEQVLAAMVTQKYIKPEEKTAALNQNLKLIPVETAIKAPHFVMYVRDWLTQKYGLRAVEQGGLEVTTTLEHQTYETAVKIVKDGVNAQKNLGVGNGAALITNPQTGEILAMVGSVDFFDLAHDGNVNVVLAKRSPGSAIKPLNYALAFEKNLITPATILDDSPVVYRSAGNLDYAPKNYDNRFHGKVSVRVALGSSYNIPAVKVLEKNGLEDFINFSRRLGITTFTDPSRFGLALTLGGGEITMLDLVQAYGVLANNGIKVNLNPILKVTDFRGRVLEDNLRPDSGERVITPKTAFLINNILADNAARTPAFGPGSNLVVPGHNVAVKTGTTQEKRDNWTIGYTPEILAAVWVGNNDNSPMSPYLESGNTGAAAIWNPLMKSLLADKPNEDWAAPEDIVAVPICAATGTLPCENCPFTRLEYFIRGTEPKFACKITKEEGEKKENP